MPTRILGGTMKKLIFFIACCCGPLVCSVAKEKRYIMLDMLDSLYQVKHYTLSAQELYGVDETIKLYNVFGEGLILFSMLPNFYGDANWSEVNIDTIREELFDERGFRRTMSARLMSGNSGDKKTLRFGLIKSDNGRHYKRTHCLTEFFHLVSYSSIFNSPYGTVNTGQSPLTIREMAALYQEEPGFGKPGQPWFPLDVRLAWTYLPKWWLLQREYLSEVFEWQGEKAYRFWTFTDWRNHDGFNTTGA